MQGTLDIDGISLQDDHFFENIGPPLLQNVDKVNLN